MRELQIPKFKIALKNAGFKKTLEIFRRHHLHIFFLLQEKKYFISTIEILEKNNNILLLIVKAKSTADSRIQIAYDLKPETSLIRKPETCLKAELIPSVRNPRKADGPPLINLRKDYEK